MTNQRRGIRMLQFIRESNAEVMRVICPSIDSGLARLDKVTDPAFWNLCRFWSVQTQSALELLIHSYVVLYLTLPDGDDMNDYAEQHAIAAWLCYVHRLRFGAHARQKLAELDSKNGT